MGTDGPHKGPQCDINSATAAGWKALRQANVFYSVYGTVMIIMSCTFLTSALSDRGTSHWCVKVFYYYGNYELFCEKFFLHS